MKRNVSKSFSVLLALALLLALVPSAHAEESALASASVDDIYVTPSASDGHLEFGKAGDVNTIFRRGVDGVDNADDKSSSPVSVADMIVKACDTMLTESQINNGELDYLSYVSVSGSQGAIYDGYNNEGDTGEGVAGVKKYYYSDSASNYLVRNIRFVPSSAFSGRALITYYGYYHYMDTTENAVKQGTFAGRIYVTVTKQVPGISYSSDGEPIRFAAEDFNTYSLAVTGRAFRYISFTPPPSSAGTMYYNYVDESIYDSEITSTSRFYRSNAPFMDSVYFVPEDDYATPKGEPLKLHFTGVDIAGYELVGDINITVTDYGPDFAGKDDGDFTFHVEPGRSVNLDCTEELTKYCADELGSDYTFSRIRIMDLPPAKSGTLYNGTGTTLVRTNTDYGASSIPRLRFEASYNFLGTVTAPFRGYASKSGSTRFFDGTFTFIVEEKNGSSAPLHYKVDPGRRVYFERTDFETVARNAMSNYSLNRIVFDSLPDSRRGTLQYLSGSTTNTVSTSKDYTLSMLSNISFLAADDFTGSVEIPFHGYSYSGSSRSGSGRSFSGTITVTSTKEGASSGAESGIGSNVQTLTYYTTGPAVRLSKDDILTAASAFRDNARTFYLSRPEDTEGKLCFDFTSLSRYVEYTAGSSYGLDQLDHVYYLPKAGFDGTAYITYTLIDTSGNTFAGNIRFVVTPPVTSSYFNDMSSYRWAIPAADFFRYYGATNGTSLSGFGPSASMRRGDFILLLSRAFGFPSAGLESFADVSPDKYYAGAIASAKSIGVITGNAKEKFYPDATITRQDAGVFLYRALLRDNAVTPAAGDFLSQFPDGGDTAEYARDAMNALVRDGVFKGYVVSLLPKRTLNRAETITILYRALT